MKQTDDVHLSVVLSVFHGPTTIPVQIRLFANIYKYLLKLLSCLLKASTDRVHDLLWKNLQISLA